MSWRMWSVTAGGATCHDRSRVTRVSCSEADLQQCSYSTDPYAILGCQDWGYPDYIADPAWAAGVICYYDEE